MTDLNLIEQGLLDCVTNNKPFQVKGYTSSDGKVEDMTVTFGGYDGYLLLLQESLKFLEDNVDPILAWNLASEEIVLNVISALKEDITKRLAPKPVEESFTSDHFKRNDKGGLTLMRLVKWDSFVIDPGKVAKSRDVSSDVKKSINARLPLHNFVYRIDLTEGKFEDVQF